ncbi:MAG: DUF2235 domain-containing protein [Pseudoxanthomonas sp.]
MGGRSHIGEPHTQEADGLLSDGVSYYPASQAQLDSYRSAEAELAQFQVPRLITTGNPNQKLFVASFDGTGNDVENDPLHATNVAGIRAQIIDAAKAGNTQVVAGYVAGPGTQSDVIAKLRDGMKGHTYDERLEEMYKQFIDQAAEWKRENPNVEINVADIGFSRGAEQAAGFSRLVHERGIQDPAGAHYKLDRDGQIKGVEYSTPPLVAPGQVAQSVALFDPVGTGVPVDEKDRRLPPSVVSGVQIIAADERRGLFKSTHIIDPGVSADGRFLGMAVAGAHSDIGGSYHRDGLAIRSGNLMTDYLNSLSDTPFLDKRAEPLEPGRNVVHRSEEGMLLYKLGNKVDRQSEEGYIERLVPKGMVDKVPDAYNAEPVDPALKGRFDYRAVQIGAVPQATAAERLAQKSDIAAPTPSLSGRDWALHDALRERMPRQLGGDDRLMQATLSARQAGIDAGSLKGVQEANGQLWVIGNTPGFRAAVDLSQPAPAAQESARAINDLNRTQQQGDLVSSRQQEQNPPQMRMH